MPAVQVDPSRQAFCYAELAVSSPVVAETIASYSLQRYYQRDGQTELLGWILGW